MPEIGNYNSINSREMLLMLEKLAELFKLAPRQFWAVEQQIEIFKDMFGSFSLKGFFASILAIIELCGLVLFDFPITPRGEEVNLEGYSLVFEDNFDGTELDTDIWEFRANGARRGGFNAPSQVEVRDGNLVITAEYLTDGAYGEGWYAGMIKLKERYCKGYFEIRCIANKGRGFWSAYWLQADGSYTASISKGGIGGAEIDIFESANNESSFVNDAVTHAIHCAGVDGIEDGFQSMSLGGFYGNNIYEEYNTYAVEWNEEEYIFYVNGIETRRSSYGNGVSEVPEEVIVSLEIPTAEELDELDKDEYVSEFIVDYVRIYQK